MGPLAAAFAPADTTLATPRSLRRDFALSQSGHSHVEPGRWRWGRFAFSIEAIYRTFKMALENFALVPKAVFVIAIALSLSGEARQPTPEALVRITGGHLAFGPIVLEMNVQQVEKVLKTRLRLVPTDNDIGCDGKEASVNIQRYAVTLTFTSASKMRLESITVRIPESRTVERFTAAFRRQVPGLRLELPIQAESGTPKPYWELASDPPQHVLVSLAEHVMWIGRGCID